MHIIENWVTPTDVIIQYKLIAQGGNLTVQSRVIMAWINHKINVMMTHYKEFFNSRNRQHDSDYHESVIQKLKVDKF